MKVTKDIHIHCSEGDLELRIGKALTTFAYKGVDKFVFRTAELGALVSMLQTGGKALDDFYRELQAEFKADAKPEPKKPEPKPEVITPAAPQAAITGSK